MLVVPEIFFSCFKSSELDVSIYNIYWLMAFLLISLKNIFCIQTISDTSSRHKRVLRPVCMMCVFVWPINVLRHLKLNEFMISRNALGFNAYRYIKQRWLYIIQKSKQQPNQPKISEDQIQGNTQKSHRFCQSIIVQLKSNY